MNILSLEMLKYSIEYIMETKKFDAVLYCSLTPKVR